MQNNNRDIHFKIDNDLFLELLFLRIRGESVQFASVLKKQINNREKQLIADIETIEVDENLQSTNFNLLADKKSELQNLRENRIKGEAIRSRAQWLTEGEKPSSFFCNLERKNFVEKTIKKLYDNMKAIVFVLNKRFCNRSKSFIQIFFKIRTRILWIHN